MLKGIDNVGIAVTDLRRSIAFYEKLGFSKGQDYEADVTGCTMTAVDSGISSQTPSKERPIWIAATVVAPNENVSGSTTVRCWLDAFVKVSARRFPGRSGMAWVLSSSTRTKPGASPLGEISICPRAFADAISMKGDLAMKARQCRSAMAIVLATHGGGGSPMSPRNRAGSVTMSLNSI